MTTVAELDERIAKCEKILQDDPNSQIFAALAESYRKKGELEKAFRVCQSGLKIHPSYASAHVVMAKINLDRGLYDWAEAEVRTAIDLGGRTRNIELLLAEIYIYKGEFNTAIKLLKQLKETDPHNEQIGRLLEIAQRLPEEQQRITEGVPDPEQTVIATNAEQQEQAPEEEQKVLDNAGVVSEAISIPGVEGALFVNFEGLVVESKWMSSMDEATCGATISEIGNELNEQLINNSFGHIRAVLIETGDVTFYVIRTETGVFLFVAGPGTNLGALRMKVEKLMGCYKP